MIPITSFYATLAIISNGDLQIHHKQLRSQRGSDEERNLTPCARAAMRSCTKAYRGCSRNAEDLDITGGRKTPSKIWRGIVGAGDKCQHLISLPL
jgi:hypothetical protein